MPDGRIDKPPGCAKFMPKPWIRETNILYASVENLYYSSLCMSQVLSTGNGVCSYFEKGHWYKALLSRYGANLRDSFKYSY